MQRIVAFNEPQNHIAFGTMTRRSLHLDMGAASPVKRSRFCLFISPFCHPLERQTRTPLPDRPLRQPFVFKSPPAPNSFPHCHPILCVSSQVRRNVLKALYYTCLLAATFASGQTTALADSQNQDENIDMLLEPQPDSQPKSKRAHFKLKQSNSIYAPVYHIDVLETFPHDRYAFTQGLTYDDGDHLFESTGKYGQSTVRRVHVRSGRVLERTNLIRAEFGEGLCLLNESFMLQVLWKTGRSHVYNRQTLQRVATFDLPGVHDSWGIATLPVYSSSSTASPTLVYVSDGSARIRVFRISITVTENDVETNGVKQTRVNVNSELFHEFSVRDGDRLVGLLNELEFVNGELWANVLMAKVIARIDVATGKVSGWLDCRTVLKPSQVPLGHKVDVLNGIAHDQKNDVVYITGKCWPTMYAIRPTNRISEPSVFDIGNAFYLDVDQVDYIHQHMIG